MYQSGVQSIRCKRTNVVSELIRARMMNKKSIMAVYKDSEKKMSQILFRNWVIPKMAKYKFQKMASFQSWLVC